MNKYLIFNAKNQFFEFTTDSELSAVTNYIENKIGFNDSFAISKDDWLVIANALVAQLGPNYFSYLIRAANGFCSKQELEITRVISSYSDILQGVD